MPSFYYAPRSYARRNTARPLLMAAGAMTETQARVAANAADLRHTPNGRL
jgi:hypothetical protein